MHKQQHEDDRKVLHALRKHVYRSTEGDLDAGIVDSEVMEAAIVAKRIVIIGGHDNWPNKLKARFDGWRFISTEISAVENLPCLMVHTIHIYIFLYGAAGSTDIRCLCKSLAGVGSAVWLYTQHECG